MRRDNMTADKDPPPAAAFHGWQRLPGQRWVKVCEGATEDEVRNKLFDVKYPGSRRDVVVLRAGTNANRRFQL